MPTLIARLNLFAAHCARHMEIVLALLLMGIVFMMILPLPTPLVDVLVGLNLCTSILLVMLSLYLPGPLAFSTFPAVLLITTLFRLAISISTTRLILLEGDAGHIVETFGNFVVGGNLAVGLVIFMILVVVQFLVITKGSERVAEVSARFALDAMPGKQLSIDSDLRAGLLQPNEARKKRMDLAQESKLYGAMDGAMKFVKGDAVAGLVIVFVNLVGGLSIGVLQQGMPAGEAIKLYSILTIGDGLVSQIPALLIAITAGIVITRVSPDHDPNQPPENLGRVIAAQLGSQPRAWGAAGIAMFGFAWIPGMPAPVFLFLSGVIGATFAKRYWQARKGAPAASGGAPTVQDLRSFNPIRPYLLQFAAGTESHPEFFKLADAFRLTRNRIVTDYGFLLPSIETEVNNALPENEFRFSLYEVPHLSGRIDQADLSGTLQRLSDLFFQTASRFIGIQEASALIGWLESEQPELAKEVQRLIPNSGLATILQRLSAERIALRNIKLIAQAIAEWGRNEQDPMLLTEYVRIALRHQICHAFCPNNQLRAYVLNHSTEAMLRNAVQQAPEGNFAFDPELFFRLIDSIRKRLKKEENMTLLVAQDLRRHIRLFIEQEALQCTVLAFPELLSEIRVDIIGHIDLTADDSEVETGTEAIESAPFNAESEMESMESEAFFLEENAANLETPLSNDNSNDEQHFAQSEPKQMIDEHMPFDDITDTPTDHAEGDLSPEHQREENDNQATDQPPEPDPDNPSAPH